MISTIEGHKVVLNEYSMQKDTHKAGTWENIIISKKKRQEGARHPPFLIYCSSVQKPRFAFAVTLNIIFFFVSTALKDGWSFPSLYIEKQGSRR